jgi:PhnB protein
MTEQTAPSIDPGVMNGVIPYLSLAGQAGAAADFYMRAFGARDLGRMAMPDDPSRIMHLQVEINGGVLMLTDHRMGDAAEPALGHGHLQLVVADGRAWFDRAVAAGCTTEVPFARQDWGDDWGMVMDPFGIRWAILQPGPERG